MAAPLPAGCVFGVSAVSFASDVAGAGSDAMIGVVFSASAFASAPGLGASAGGGVTFASALAAGLAALPLATVASFRPPLLPRAAFGFALAGGGASAAGSGSEPQ